MSSSTVIGISFGNSSSCIAYTNPEGKTEVLANQDGDRQIPSILGYLEGEEYHGNQAKQQLVRNKDNVICGFREVIDNFGFCSDDINLLSFSAIDLALNPYSAQPSQSSEGPVYTLTNGEKILIPELLKRHFRRLKESSEDYLGREVSGVILSYPTDFSHRQRNILIEAAQDAGLNILQLLSEPAAAMLSSSSLDGRYLILDVGGYRTDVAVISKQGGLFTILGTSHALGLGGNQLDEALAHFFAAEFSKKNGGINLTVDSRAMTKLRLASEETKKALSAKSSATTSVESVYQGIDFHSSVNRIRFDMIGRSVINEVEKLVETVLTKCELLDVDINHVLMIGGSSSVTALQSLMSSKFSNVIIPENTSEAIALGCAIQGSLIEDFDQEEVEEATQATITNVPHVSSAIGLNIDGNFETIVPEFSAIPYRGKLVLAANPSGVSYISIWEARKELVISKELPENVESDEEQEEKRIRVHIPDRKIADMILKTSKTEVEVCVQCTAEGKAVVTAREIGGTEVVRGEVEIANKE
ncbi:Heat shock protein 70 [Neolecta irregularis DAH-3]|uniref:Heat shock protein 70 n=1 Tax=Neolecta irregularis (strain DAH-3) TaxID=1198029 RepID=A0A1U7LJM7_NEOID|nr:Heat shock protein 70 [Neolecta irregularis DAH-3]|eukprot:OLL22860.1 Heat shock protein 70 [Neolecta irregularis DAH-3]